jgi:5-methylcytosine-specific restriction endonuclease McrA
MIKDTKVNRKKIMGEFLDSIPLNQDFSDKEVAIVNAITGWNYKAYQKRLTPPPNASTRNIWVKDTKDFKSWNKAIDAKPIDAKRRQDVAQACRAAIVPLLNDIRQFATECEYCGNTDNLQVDHKTTPFSSMFEEWFEQNPNVDTGTGLKQIGHNLIKPEEFDSWIEYHDARADYQILCRSCNASKGKK